MGAYSGHYSICRTNTICRGEKKWERQWSPCKCKVDLEVTGGKYLTADQYVPPGALQSKVVAYLCMGDGAALGWRAWWLNKSDVKHPNTSRATRGSAFVSWLHRFFLLSTAQSTLPPAHNPQRCLLAEQGHNSISIIPWNGVMLTQSTVSF